ncbi:MAG TPA: hypothetical protein VE263_16745 [Candidatus Angelobacter sp.]|nr:hypothetical protein [Candidatus Angelobacter sp.]
MKPKHLLALGVLAAVAAASLAVAQKPAPAQPTEQQKLRDRVEALESQLKEAQAKADRAAMEKDYITRVQKQYETYYKEVFSTQTHILWTIGVTVTLLSITLSIVFFVAGRFGFNIFDRRIEMSLKEGSTQLRAEFAERLSNETNALQAVHAAELKTLEDGLTKRITDLEDGFVKRFNQQEEDLMAKSDYQFHFAQGISTLVNKVWDPAIKQFRLALGVFKNAKPRGIFAKHQGNRTTANIFLAIRARDKEKFAEAAKKELELDVYQGLDDELNYAASEVPELAPLLKKEK